jgi:hypothetical protein
MHRSDLILGALIGLTGALAGSMLFVALFTPYTLTDGIFIVKQTQQVSKLLSLGAILNLAIFFVLLRFKKDVVAKGVLLSMFVIVVTTLILKYI